LELEKNSTEQNKQDDYLSALERGLRSLCHGAESQCALDSPIAQVPRAMRGAADCTSARLMTSQLRRWVNRKELGQLLREQFVVDEELFSITHGLIASRYVS
jgi:hypothetical protein